MAVPICSIRGTVALSAIALATGLFAGCNPTVRSSGTSAGSTEQGVFDPSVAEDVDDERLSALPANSPKGPPVPPAPTLDAYLGGISPAVFAQLKYLPLMAPAYIPEGFSLVKHDMLKSGYFLVYRSESDECFAIEHLLPTALSARQEALAEQATFADETTTWSQKISLGQDEPTGVAVSTSSGAELPTSEPSPTSNPSFREFTSPVFGAGKKIFYGKSAQEIAAADIAIATVQRPADSVTPSPEPVAAHQSAGTASTVAAASSSAAAQPSNASSVSQWLTNSKGSYRYLSGAVVTQSYPAQMPCANVALETAVKITTSLADLTAEPTD